MKFNIEKVSNMIVITDNSEQFYKAWDESNFTEKKLQNAMKKIQDCYKEKIEFERV